MYFSCPAQNLIPNPSFENYNEYVGVIGNPALYLDTSHTYFYGCTEWWSATYPGISGVQSDSIILNGLVYEFPYKAHSGQSYGVVANGGDYNNVGKSFLQCKLKEPLKEGCYYSFKIWFMPDLVVRSDLFPDTNVYSCNHLGFYFSDTAIYDRSGINEVSYKVRNQISNNHFLNFTPQLEIPKDTFFTDTTNWFHFTGVLKADDSYTYLTIGNFYTPYQSLYKQLAGGKINTPIPGVEGSVSSAFYLDDLSLEEIPPPDTLLHMSENLSVCKGEVVQLQARANGATHISWSNSMQGEHILVSDSGWYVATAYYACGYQLVDSVHVLFKDKEQPQMVLNDTVVCEGKGLTLNLPMGYQYFINNTEVQDVHPTLSVTGDYVVTLQDSCSSYTYAFNLKDSICELKVFVPNAFTPNADGKNDCFKVVSGPVTSYSLQIYNRWGSLVFNSNSKEECWDGYYKGKVQKGVFVYVLDIVGEQGEIFKKRGEVLVLR